VIGPREADAQLAHLARNGMTQCVYSLDSDLLVHLLDCPYPITWFRQVNRNVSTCRTVHLDVLRHDPREKKLGQSPDLLTMIRADASRLLLLDYAITVGCDYVEWTGIGPKKALQIIQSLSAQGGAGNTEALAGYLYCRSFVMFHLSLFCCR
jgi:5'-3' exonuclease